MSHAPNDDAPMGDDLPDDLAAAPEPDSSGSRSVGRRTFLRGATVGAGSLAAGGFSIRYSTREAEAIAPVVLAGAAAGAVAVGWALREYEVIGKDDVADGLSGDAAREAIKNTARTRQSTNASTFIDNRNIIDSGVEDSAYGDGKVAAIQALNNESTEQECIDAAHAEIDLKEETVITNFLKSWNESVREVKSLVNTQENHADVSNNFVAISGGVQASSINWDWTSTTTYTFNNGNTFTIEDISVNSTYIDKQRDGSGGSNTDWSNTYNPLNDPNIHGDSQIAVDGYSIEYMEAEDWADVLDRLEAAFQSARDNVALWVGNIYSDVQAGELDTANLLTSSELANMTTDNSEFNQAVADLTALNIKSDIGSQMVVNPSNVDAEIPGSLSSTGEVTFTAGNTVDPSADSYSYYFTYDTAAASGDWADYQTGIDGGVITFTAEPLDATEYTVTTNNDETVAIMTDDLADQGDGTWTYDASADLENDISEISSVEFGAPGSETNFVTVQLTSPFTVVSITNDAGDSVDSTAVTSPEPHNDSNYITQEEWDDREQRHQELIEKYEQSQGGGGGFVDGLGFGGLPGEGVLVGIIGIVVVLLGQSD